MTRRRLWSLTALACLVLALPGLPSGWWAPASGRLMASLDAVWAALQLAGSRLPPPDPRAVQVAVAVAAIVMGLGLVVRRQRRPAAAMATALARRGRSVPAIARRTGLAQDAVRDLLGGDPMAVSTAGKGRFFRRARPSAPSAAGTFADELREKSFEASA